MTNAQPSSQPLPEQTAGRTERDITGDSEVVG
jgi:hypothetical protein